ncbi:MAG TPA: threonine-phosphate decarboxylase CobD, partial [Gemmataceae bacterium]|nr:threonine-phosphate decarboxylase CobD [Gemmataceae bacterium]
AGPVLDFSAGLNPLGPPPGVWRALRDRTAVTRYPDPDCRALTERLAALHRLEPAQVVVGNGASEIIHALPRAFPAARVAIAEPTYTEYLRASWLAGAAVTHWLPADESFRPAPFPVDGAGLVWLCNPNNPTGQLWPPGPLRAWVAAHPRTLFVVDESFLPFHPDEQEHSLVPAVAGADNLVVVRSLTKLYAIPGLRLGYAITSPERAACLRAQLPPWSVNAFAQAAGLAALEDAAFLRRTHAWFREEARPFAAHLRGLGGLPSEAPFVLLRLGGVTSARLTARLRRHGLLVRDAANFVGLGPQYVRVAVRTAEENATLLGALRDGLASAETEPAE